MKTPNRVGFQLSQELCDILNHGNELIEKACGNKPYHSLNCADWEPDGHVEIHMYTNSTDYPKMKPALEELCRDLQRADYLRGESWVELPSSEDSKVNIGINLQHVNITVKDENRTGVRVVKYEEYSNRLYACKPKGKDEVWRVQIRDGRLESPFIKEQYEWIYCCQNSVEDIQDVLDKKMGKGTYIAVTGINVTRDRRNKPIPFNTFYKREGAYIRYDRYTGYNELWAEGVISISEKEYEQLKALGITEKD